MGNVSHKHCRDPVVRMKVDRVLRGLWAKSHKERSLRHPHVGEDRGQHVVEISQLNDPPLTWNQENSSVVGYEDKELEKLLRHLYAEADDLDPKAVLDNNWHLLTPSLPCFVLWTKT